MITEIVLALGYNNIDKWLPANEIEHSQTRKETETEHSQTSAKPFEPNVQISKTQPYESYHNEERKKDPTLLIIQMFL